MLPRKRSNGAYALQFRYNGEKHNLYLGKITKADANKIASEVEKIVSYSRKDLELPPDSLDWLRSISPKLRDRLSEIGLVKSSLSITYKQLLKLFLRDFCDGSRRPNTEERMERSLRTAEDVFGSTVVSEIGIDLADTFFAKLKRRYQSTATWTKSLNDSKQVFRWGIEKGLISTNPIRHLKGGSMANDARMHYVPADVIEEVIDVSSDDWILIFALARYAGLRVPSEFTRLRWEDVNWNKETLTIYAPKTKSKRVCPIFPQLWKRLSDAWEALPPGTKGKAHIIQAEKRRLLESNLRTQAIKLINRSGNDLWPKLFQNLRMSCATDLLNHYHVQKVAAWLGHSVNVLLKHYHGSTGSEIQTALEQTPDPFTQKESLENACRKSSNSHSN